jgi:N-acetylglutamate synthase-like GNAT family acetyltransferase
MKQYILTDDPEMVDVVFVEKMLHTTYWASTRNRTKIEGAIATSINFSVYENDKQIAYARVVTDKYCFAWIADVIVDPEYRHNGIGSWMIECILKHSDIKHTTQQILRTKDAHKLYSPFGFEIAECMSRKLEK